MVCSTFHGDADPALGDDGLWFDDGFCDVGILHVSELGEVWSFDWFSRLDVVTGCAAYFTDDFSTSLGVSFMFGNVEDDVFDRYFADLFYQVLFLNRSWVELRDIGFIFLQFGNELSFGICIELSVDCIEK